MRLKPRSALIAAVVAAVALLAVLMVVRSVDVESPSADDQIVASEPADAAPTEQAPTAVAVVPTSPPPATPTVVVVAPAVASPVARSASSDPASSAGTQRATTQATFLVSNTLGRGMALRTAPISREPGKVWPDGTRMVGLGAEQEAYGWTWRFVRDPDGNIGWMPSNYLIQDETAPVAPSRGSGLLPPSAPPTLILIPTVGLPEPTSTIGPTPRAGSSVGGDPTPGTVPNGTTGPTSATGLPVVSKETPTASGANWALAYDRVEATDRRLVSNETGVTRTQTASGRFQRIYFRLQNRQKQSSAVSGGMLTLTDGQGRTYTSDFELRQVQPDGSLSEYSSASIAPGATVALAITFDVTPDATGLVLHMRGGNDIRIE